MSIIYLHDKYGWSYYNLLYKHICRSHIGDLIVCFQFLCIGYPKHIFQLPWHSLNKTNLTGLCWNWVICFRNHINSVTINCTNSKNNKNIKLITLLKQYGICWLKINHILMLYHVLTSWTWLYILRTHNIQMHIQLQKVKLHYITLAYGYISITEGVILSFGLLKELLMHLI